MLLGLAASGFAAVAGHRPMLRMPADRLEAIGASAYAGDDFNRIEFPLAGALALVTLACWGVLLVTRGIVRRVVAGLATLAALGVVVVVAIGGFVQQDDAALDLGNRIGLGGAIVPVERTPWLWVALGTGVLAVAAGLGALRLVGSWPEMGTRYDAPTGSTATAAPPPENAADQTNLDLWKSLDEGTDPTEPPTGRGPGDRHP